MKCTLIIKKHGKRSLGHCGPLPLRFDISRLKENGVLVAEDGEYHWPHC